MEKDDEEIERPERPSMPLKGSGEMMNVVWAQLWTENLRELLEKYPDEFKALKALIEGRREEVSESMVMRLRDWGKYLNQDGLPVPGVSAVMKAAYRETLEGPCLVDPLELKTKQDFYLYESIESLRDIRTQEGLKRMAKKMFDDSMSGGDPSR